MPAFTEISLRGWALIARWALFGTVGCLIVSLLVTWGLFHDQPAPIRQRAFLSAAFLSILLAAPLFGFMTLKLRQLAIANHRLATLAATDSLTGGLNRGAFVQRVEDWLAEHGGQRREAVGALLLLDVDHFKAINDTHGHDRGDEVLRGIASLLRARSRTGDIVGRLGGEEFAVFLPGATPQEAAAVSERLRRGIEETSFAAAGATLGVTASIGCASFVGATGLTDLMKTADERLYRAKRSGRNRVCAHTPAFEPAEALRAVG